MTTFLHSLGQTLPWRPRRLTSGAGQTAVVRGPKADIARVTSEIGAKAVVDPSGLDVADVPGGDIRIRIADVRVPTEAN